MSEHSQGLADAPAAGGAGAPATSLWIAGAELEGRPVDLFVAGNRIAAIEPHRPDRPTPPGARRVEGRRCAVLPGLMNAHTHSAMAILRSYADDMPLMPWLTEKIWPLEARLTEADVYWGTRLACLEMIRSGTTFFNDMYWHFHGTARAARDSGMRAQVAGVLIDAGDPAGTERQHEAVLEQLESVSTYGSRVGFALGPHAVYTVGAASLAWVADLAQSRDLPIHIHVSETVGEVAACVDAHGMRPPAWLDRLGLLGPRTLAAHCVHLDDAELQLLAERGVTAIHNPISNLKLASGGPMRYAAMRELGLRVTIGTDGCASNNNLDLLEELKFAALLAKHACGDPTRLPAAEALDLATRQAADAFGLDCGRIEPGRLADLILVDLEHPMMFPGHGLPADLVYSAQGRAVRSTICDGQVLMEDGRVEDEAAIRAEVRARWSRIAGEA
ncbi:MAG: amidohydrolase [Caldilineae bacterium]|nr:amidohydrolase [Chloroflexota bacterium]MCB9175687.1 amidohydrolase [Caldilineae bacterium]